MEAKRDHVRSRILTLLAEAAGVLAQAGVENSKLDASVLLAAVLGVDRSRLFTGSASFDGRSILRFHKFVARRAAREPLAYIVCHKEFFGLDFVVSPEVLIPRPETESIVEAALAALSGKPRAAVLDLGTGSGAIAVAIATNAPDAQVTATDIAPDALKTARRNAAHHGCLARIEFALGDCWAALSCSHPKFDLIVSNPPYVRDDEMGGLQPEVARYEPEIALRGGKDGLDFYRRIAAEVDSHLNSGGEIIVEVGAGQAAEVARILKDGGCCAVETIRDLAGHERVVRARLTA
ncbi:MAG TPA: peptide chain release factor N(5)-glutamine methyltransferase [Candidatus Binataceae bacterium]|jgi:release factor glutamine methyltransferase|nr:peptide chain release factor N(5)-glutamine methyltransferase [Candidatus Binataceae bacterium]